MLENLRRVLSSEVFLAPFDGQSVTTTSEGKIYRVPQRLLVELPRYSVVAIGEEAREVEHAGVGKTKVIIPFSSAEIFDEQASEVFTRALFRVALSSRFLLKPRVWQTLPEDTSPFMRELWRLVLFRSGAREVRFIHPLRALAAGLALPIHESHGYALGRVERGGCSIGLGVFGDIRFEVSRSGELPEEKWSHVLEGVWREFQEKLPVEYWPTILSEGLLLVSSDADLHLSLTKILKVPVTVVDPSTLVLGLRSMMKENSIV